MWKCDHSVTGGHREGTRRVVWLVYSDLAQAGNVNKNKNMLRLNIDTYLDVLRFANQILGLVASPGTMAVGFVVISM